MIWSLQFRILCKKTAAITLHSSINTSAVLFARKQTRADRKHWREVSQIDSALTQDLKNEIVIDADFDLKKPEEAFDLQVWEQKKHRKRIRRIITAKKFFAPRPQPLMLTWNERQCIRYLHNEDPVQWNIKSLSESFPATPDTIKKIIKSKKKISSERAKLLDLKAQKNWELLAEGKLDADPHVLEHLRKFTNRREILLEQIQKADFYVPEVKVEPVWNQGEMNKILVDYEKALNKLTTEAQQDESLKVLSDGMSKEKNIRKEGKSNLDLIHEKIEMKCKKKPELTDSFMYSEMTNAFKKPVTLEDLEYKILRKAERRKKLDLIEKAVLDCKLGVNVSENNKNSSLRECMSSAPDSVVKESGLCTPSLKKNLKLGNKISVESDKKLRFDRIKTANTNPDKVISLDNRPQIMNKTENSEPLKTDIILQKAKVTEKKQEIDFSDPVRLQNEKVYYDQQVSDIKNTAFWNNERRSQEKAMTEFSKQTLEVPTFCNAKTDIPKTSILSADPYPKRIKIPKDKRGSGLTFKIKDCYYDDDGEFLYRVPGMTK